MKFTSLIATLAVATSLVSALPVDPPHHTNGADASAPIRNDGSGVPYSAGVKFGNLPPSDDDLIYEDPNLNNIVRPTAAASTSNEGIFGNRANLQFNHRGALDELDGDDDGTHSGSETEVEEFDDSDYYPLETDSAE